MEELVQPTWLHGVAAVVTAVLSGAVGWRVATVRTVSGRVAAEHREREQLFQHYNELVQTNREVNHGLRTELAAVRGEVAQLHAAHARVVADFAREREECRVTNAKLTAEVEHLKLETARLRNRRAGGGTDAAPAG